MLQVLKDLFKSPEAERDPADWLSRYMAHDGAAAFLWLAVLSFTREPESAALAVVVVYAAWEAMQWRGGVRMALDGLLDWCAFTTRACALVQVWHQEAGAALAFTALSLAIMVAGVWRRTKRRPNV